MLMTRTPRSASHSPSPDFSFIGLFLPTGFLRARGSRRWRSGASMASGGHISSGTRSGLSRQRSRSREKGTRQANQAQRHDVSWPVSHLRLRPIWASWKWGA